MSSTQGLEGKIHHNEILLVQFKILWAQIKVRNLELIVNIKFVTELLSINRQNQKSRRFKF